MLRYVNTFEQRMHNINIPYIPYKHSILFKYSRCSWKCWRRSYSTNRTSSPVSFSLIWIRI